MPHPVVAVCSNGHVIAEVGRYRSDRDKYGPCKACNRDAQTRARARRAQALAEIKLSTGCIRCGYRRSAWALDFHHRDPVTKSFSIGSANRCKRWDVMLAEIEKCDVVCRNCHAEIHEEGQ